MDETKERDIRARLAEARQPIDRVDAGVLDPVPYTYAGRRLDVQVVAEEFTHICPMTGLPDFGEVEIRYIPEASIVELKSLKYYLTQYRQVGVFYEHLAHRILDDLVAAVRPRAATVRYTVRPRGGLRSVVRADWPEGEGPE